MLVLSASPASVLGLFTKTFKQRPLEVLVPQNPCMPTRLSTMDLTPVSWLLEGRGGYSCFEAGERPLGTSPQKESQIHTLNRPRWPIESDCSLCQGHRHEVEYCKCHRDSSFEASIILPVLHMREVRLRDTEKVAQTYSSSQCWDPLGLLGSSAMSDSHSRTSSLLSLCSSH